MGSCSKLNVVTQLTCPHCAGPLSKEMETSRWTVQPLIRDNFSMIGSAVGVTSSAFYGFNYGDLSCWFFSACHASCSEVGQSTNVAAFSYWGSPVIVFSSACAGLAGGAVPALAQLASSSYHATNFSSSLSHSSQDDEAHQSRTSSTL